MRSRIRPWVCAFLIVLLGVSSQTPMRATGPRLSLLPLMKPGLAPGPFVSACLNMDQWPGVRGNTHLLGVAIQWVNDVPTDQLAQCFANMRANGIGLVLELGVVKDCLGLECYNQGHSYVFDRLQYEFNAPLAAIQLDDPLSFGRDRHITDEASAGYICDYLQVVRQRFPQLEVIEDEAFPLMSVSDLIGFMPTVRSACQARGTAPPNTFQLDHDWAAGGWNFQQVRDIRDFAHIYGMNFGLEYWNANDSTYEPEWYNRTWQYAMSVHLNGVNPDLYTVEAFMNIPVTTIPESSPFTFMWSARELITQGLLPGTINPPSESTTAYEHIDYVGESLAVTADMSFVGWDWNDRMSSIHVPAGRTVTLYEHANYDGASLTLTSDASDLRNFPGPGADGTWNDTVSSIRIQ